MYKIEFYQNKYGESEVWDFLEALREKSQSSKDARIQYNQIIFYIDLLAKNGTNLPVNITKHLRKKSQKTPKREITRARAERDDYIRQKEAEQ